MSSEMKMKADSEGNKTISVYFICLMKMLNEFFWCIFLLLCPYAKESEFSRYVDLLIKKNRLLNANLKNLLLISSSLWIAIDFYDYRNWHTIIHLWFHLCLTVSFHLWLYNSIIPLNWHISFFYWDIFMIIEIWALIFRLHIVQAAVR